MWPNVNQKSQTCLERLSLRYRVIRPRTSCHPEELSPRPSSGPAPREAARANARTTKPWPPWNLPLPPEKLSSFSRPSWPLHPPQGRAGLYFVQTYNCSASHVPARPHRHPELPFNVTIRREHLLSTLHSFACWPPMTLVHLASKKPQGIKTFKAGSPPTEHNGAIEQPTHP